VQDFLNTRSVSGAADLLADREVAQHWLDAAFDEWSLKSGGQQIRANLSDADVDKLRDFRSDLHALFASRGSGPAMSLLPTASIAARLESHGRAVLEPRGDGARRVSATVLIEVFTAQTLDTWRRLKVCRNERCSASFYDRSRNNSGVWHDARVCGNAINLRASRARKRQGMARIAPAAHSQHEAATEA
jgi:hypothetical protein